MSKLTKPKKMIKKIHASIKREPALYNLLTKKLRTLDAPKQSLGLQRITKNLWFKECGLTIEELYEVVVEEYNNVKVLELLNAY